ncbi:MAG: four helix bundle protein [Parabacteroides sp.]|nr:four helix bundle protein [Parabacteroides sp.]
MRNHKNLIVWQKSIKLVKRLYEVTNTFPKDEIYGITSQMRRSAVSIPSNIAEGFARSHDKELLHFLYISLGSASELETQLIICREINYLSAELFKEMMEMNSEVIRMLSSLIGKRRNIAF